MIARAASALMALIPLCLMLNPALAGPLNPPPGPITSTYKTLGEVEPRIPISAPTVISAAGSYYLTNNIQNPSGSDAILITASNVTLDFNGYRILGGRTGVYVIFGVVGNNNVTIKNGTISSTTGSGIFCDGFDTGPFGITVQNMKVINTTDIGINVGRGSTVENCYVRGGNIGIDTGFSSRVAGCIVESCRSTGYLIAGGSTVTDCVAVGIDDGNGGGTGFEFGAGCTVSRIASRSNAGYGALIGQECLVSESTFTNNGNAGAWLSNFVKFSGCTVSSNGNSGVFIGDFAVGAAVEGCSVTFNTRSGIVSFSGGNHTIRGNSVKRNTDFGVRVADNCQIIENDICENGTLQNTNNRGVFVTGAGNIVRNNSFILNVGGAFEFFTGSSGNLAHSNTIRGPAIINSGTGNVIAPLVTAATAVNGANPMANISY